MKIKCLIIALFLCAGLNAQTNAVLGGAGICNVDQDPDNITDMQTQDERYECLLAWDEDNQILYVYDGTGGANKWTDHLANAGANTNTRLDNPRVVGGDVVFDRVDVTNGDNVLGTETISKLDIAPIQGVNGGTAITVTINGSGQATIANDLPEATTVSDGTTIDLTETGNDITAEVIDGSITPTKLDRTYSEEQSQGAYKNHADAAANSVAIGEYFYAATNNTMGISPGTKVRRMF